MRPISPRRCPRCDYNLTGLPPPHRCPECGLEYDEHTRIWLPSTRFPFLSGILFLSVVVLTLIMPLLGSFLPRMNAGFAGLLAFCLIALVVFVGLRMRAIHRRRFLIAVTPAGLLVRIGEPTLIPWPDLRAVIERQGSVRIQRKGSVLPLDVPNFFRHGVEFKLLSDAVAEAKARYSAPGSETDVPTGHC